MTFPRVKAKMILSSALEGKKDVLRSQEGRERSGLAGGEKAVPHPRGPSSSSLDPILTNFRAGMSDHMHSAGPNSPGQGHPIQHHGSFHQGQRSARLSMDPCRLVMLDVVTSSANQSLPNVSAIHSESSLPTRETAPFVQQTKG